MTEINVLSELEEGVERPDRDTKKTHCCICGKALDPFETYQHIAEHRKELEP